MNCELNITVARPIEVGTKMFPSQGAAISHFREMLSRYCPGDRVSDADAADLESLLGRYPFRGEIVAMGREIDHFEVQWSDFEKTCFRAVLDDGSWQRFSYIKCIVPVRTRRLVRFR